MEAQTQEQERLKTIHLRKSCKRAGEDILSLSVMLDQRTAEPEAIVFVLQKIGYDLLGIANE